MHTGTAPNHSVKPTRSGLRPPRAAYLKRWAERNTVRAMRRSSHFPPPCLAYAWHARPGALGERPSPTTAGAHNRPSGLSVRWRPAHRLLPTIATTCGRACAALRGSSAPRRQARRWLVTLVSSSCKKLSRSAQPIVPTDALRPAASARG